MRLAAILAVLPVSAMAYEDPTKAALFLGGVIGSEQACGLAFVPSAIDAYISAQIDPTETTFTSALGLMITGTKEQAKTMTPAALEAHCSSVRQSARTYGLIR